jgi:hypothetical protein
LQDTYAVLPEAGQAQLRVFNGFNCRVKVDIPGVDESIIEPLSFWQAPTLSVNGENIYSISVTNDGTCEEHLEFQGFVNVTEKQVIFCESLITVTNLTSLLIHLQMTRIIFIVYEASKTSASQSDENI